MIHYCAYTRDITSDFFEDIKLHNILFDPHLNRTRLWLSESDPVHQLFYLRWSTLLHNIEHEQDHALGI